MHYIFVYAGTCSCPCDPGWDLMDMTQASGEVVKPVVTWQDHRHAATVYWPVDPTRVIENEAVDLLREQVKAWALVRAV
mgnify:CR=1 FL=1